jgi:hypothetical protein
MMASKTELNRIIKEKEATIKRLKTINDMINKKLVLEADKSMKLLNAVHEGAAIVEKLQSIKWWQIWK